MTGRKELIVFDWDKTISDRCTEETVISLLSEEQQRRAEEVHADPECSWQEKMDLLSEALHARGFTEDSLRQVVGSLKLTAGMEGLLTHIKENEGKYDCVVVSDANEFFIRSMIDANLRTLEGAFDRVLTNPCSFNRDGRMVVEACMPGHGNLQGNSRCPENMCKSAVLKWFLKEKEKCGVTYNTVRYVGDGENDLCPGENVLTHRDNLYVRRGNYQMYNLLREDPARRRSIKARVVFWENGDDITQDLMLSK